mgnify:FL=1
MTTTTAMVLIGLAIIFLAVLLERLRMVSLVGAVSMVLGSLIMVIVTVLMGSGPR